MIPTTAAKNMHESSSDQLSSYASFVLWPILVLLLLVCIAVFLYSRQQRKTLENRLESIRRGDDQLQRVDNDPLLPPANSSEDLAESHRPNLTLIESPLIVPPPVHHISHLQAREIEEILETMFDAPSSEQIHAPLRSVGVDHERHRSNAMRHHHSASNVPPHPRSIDGRPSSGPTVNRPTNMADRAALMRRAIAENERLRPEPVVTYDATTVPANEVEPLYALASDFGSDFADFLPNVRRVLKGPFSSDGAGPTLSNNDGPAPISQSWKDTMMSSHVPSEVPRAPLVQEEYIDITARCSALEGSPHTSHSIEQSQNATEQAPPPYF